MINAIFIITVTIVFGGSLTFANIHTIKNFKRDKDFFFLMLLIVANIAYLLVYLPASIAAFTSLF